MQSGLKKTKNWVVEFDFDSSLRKDVLMGWNSSENTNKQIKLDFESLDDAKKWCTQNNYDFRVINEVVKKIKPKSYASNFSSKRRVSWTH